MENDIAFKHTRGPAILARIGFKFYIMKPDGSGTRIATGGRFAAREPPTYNPYWFGLFLNIPETSDGAK